MGIKLLAVVVGNLRTVRARTTVAATGVVTLAFGAGAMFLLSVLNTRLIDNLDSSSRTRAADIATLASQGPLPAELSLTGQDEAIVQVTRNGSVVSATGELQISAPLPGPTPPVGSTTTSTIDGSPLGDEGATFRVVTSSVSTPQGTLVIRIASDLDTVHKVTPQGHRRGPEHPGGRTPAAGARGRRDDVGPCDHDRPELAEVEPGHTGACHLAAEVPTMAAGDRNRDPRPARRAPERPRLARRADQAATSPGPMS